MSTSTRNQEANGNGPCPEIPCKTEVTMGSDTANTAAPAQPQVPLVPRRPWPGWIVPTAIFGLAGILLYIIAGNWSEWTAKSARQTTDDAYLHSDLTPLSTKVSGVVAKVKVADYQHVKA